MTRAPILFCLASVLLLASPVRAQSAEDRAAADALYSEAGELMKANRFAEACPKLETSQRLDPGIGTQIRLGYCYENVGRTASSWSSYNDAEAQARRAGDKRADDAALRAKALEPKLSRLLLAPASPAPGLEVLRDGKRIDPGLWGTAVPVDPGEHVIEASAPGRQPWKSSARVSPAPGTLTIAIPVLVAALDTPKEAAASPFWIDQRIAGVVVGGAGLVALGVALGFGAHARSLYNDSLAHCLPTDPTRCYAEGVSLRNQAYAAGNVATPTFIAGGIALAAGVVTFFAAPSRKPKPSTGVRGLELQPVVGTRTGALHLRGAW